MANETWFILEDETPADPRDVAQDKNGKLRHRDGRAVAYAPHGPRSRSVDAEVERSKSRQPKPKPEAPAAAPSASAAGVPASRDMKPAETVEKPRPGYQTRDSKPE